MIIPVLPAVIMFYYLYSKSTWVILGVLILLNIFSADLKTYRTVFLQDKQSEYIEAARTYGAGDLRIIFRYLIPRRLPILIPRLIIAVPIFMYLEATLSYIGVSGYYVPTWGKMILNAMYNGGIPNHTYWYLQPTVLFLLVGASFTMLGLTLEQFWSTNK